MPSKGKQRASRQAQLRSKRKRSRSHVVDSRRDHSEPRNTTTEDTSFSADTTPASPTRRPEPETRATASSPAALNYPYLGSELKRIAIVSGIVVIALVGFSFI
ncbi:MAG: hypothetical protein CL698_07830 [Chloroflexi bacterium]|nr:hypothetical protein [Chloroflexota bacterium]MBE42854.1 hypothetical protein [Chloroflexota bacterium]|tara:strand:+ start:114 stop:422 length:309 start_codon:yes stop_codon:yes gene_type:complete